MRLIHSVVIIGIFTLLPPLSRAADSNSLQDEVHEADHVREEYTKSYQQINQLNPLSSEYKPQSLSDSPLSPGSHDAPYDKVKKLLANPIVHKTLKALSNPTWSQVIHQILDHPNRNYIFIGEGVWFLFLIVFRAWRSAKIPPIRWFRRLFLTFWTFVMYVAGSIAVPYFFIGTPYLNLLRLFMTLG